MASIHSTTQNSSDNLPSYLQTNIIAQMLSIGGEGQGDHWCGNCEKLDSYNTSHVTLCGCFVAGGVSTFPVEPRSWFVSLHVIAFHYMLLLSLKARSFLCGPAEYLFCAVGSYRPTIFQTPFIAVHSPIWGMCGTYSRAKNSIGAIFPRCHFWIISDS